MKLRKTSSVPRSRRSEIAPLQTSMDVSNPEIEMPPVTWVASRTRVSDTDTWLGVSVTETIGSSDEAIIVPVPWADHVGRDFNARRLHYIAQATGKVVIGIDQLNMGITSENFVGPYRRLINRVMGKNSDRSAILERAQERSLRDGSFRSMGDASWTAIANTLFSMRKSALYKEEESLTPLESRLLTVDGASPDEVMKNIMTAFSSYDLFGYSLGASTAAGMQGTLPENVVLKNLLLLEAVGLKKPFSRLGRIALGLKFGLSTLAGKKALKETADAGLSSGLRKDELVLGLLPRLALTHYVSMCKYFTRAMAKGKIPTDLDLSRLKQDGTNVSVARAKKSLVSSGRSNTQFADSLNDEGVPVQYDVIKGYDHMVWDSLPELIPMLVERFKDR